MILSDNWIKRQCIPPTHLLITISGSESRSMEERLCWEGITHTKEQLESLCNRYHATKLKTESEVRGTGWKPMITPFHDHLVREREQRITADEGYLDRVVSYGVSSYGYDIRCSSEFKVFTNVHSGVIDPKNFDEEKNLVPINTPVCIIPPNSFALARTVERFDIPRDVLAICLGKSTYARCFTGDTRVALVDGTSASFTELVERAAKGERFFGYSADEEGNVVVSELTAPRKVGHERVLAVTLDNGKVIRCTPDHKFMLRDGNYAEAQHLTPGSSLMPLYRGEYRGYESVYQPNVGMMISTHWLADAWNLRHGVYSESEVRHHRHHRDHNRRNNRPDNIERLLASEHLALHNAERWTEEARGEHGRKIAVALSQFADDKEWFDNYREQQSRRAAAFWLEPEYADARRALVESRQNVSEETRQKHRDTMIARFASAEERERHSERMKEAWANDSARRDQQREVARSINLREDITDVIVRKALEIMGSIRGAARYLNCDRSVFRRFPDILSWFYETKLDNNHKVVSVTEVEGTHDVYCLTVPEFGNFALESGVIVKNCGIIVNVTPAEPEWEGYLTLEFSNTTTLPAKIYADEGVAQLLFLKGERPCDVSYKDRNGKYMNQEAQPIAPRI